MRGDLVLRALEGFLDNASLADYEWNNEMDALEGYHLALAHVRGALLFCAALESRSDVFLGKLEDPVPF